MSGRSFEQGRALQISVGPLSEASRRLYERRLARLGDEEESATPSASLRYSRELERALTGNWSGVEDGEETAVAAFFRAPEQANRQWREGQARTAFCYLLLDPERLARLQGVSVPSAQIDPRLFADFVASIFYVGKGKSNRPYAHLQVANFDSPPLCRTEVHLQDALDVWGKDGTELGSKLARIVSIWDAGAGVVSLHLFHNSLGVEALSREAAMVEALTLEALTNKRKGDYYGPPSSWHPSRRRTYGVALLRTAFRLFLLHPPSPLLPHNVPPRVNFARSPASSPRKSPTSH